MPSHPNITITYFDLAGRAEPARLALHIAGIPFVDERLKRDEWPSYKAKAPFGQCPMMTVDGEIYAQSNAITRYAGRLANLYPSDPIKALPVDMVLDKITDIAETLSPTFCETDAEKRLALRKKLASDVLPPHFAQLDKYICKKSPNYAVGDSMTIADLAIFNFVNWFKSGMLDGIPADLVSPYRNVCSVCDTVSKNPKVQDWYQKHPTKSA